MASQAKTFVDPGQVLDQLSIKAGQQVADFGAGSGYFSFEFAKRVGAEGHVEALDILPSALEAIESHTKMLGIHNLSTRRTNLEREGGS